MKREDLIAFSREGSRQRMWMVLGTMAFSLVWMGVLFANADAILDWGVSRFLVLAAVPIVAMVLLAVKVILSMPKCPHCGIRLVGPLLTAAVASGNCGHCGRSVVET